MNKTAVLSIITVSLLILGILSGTKLFITVKQTPEEKIHYHAGFSVYENNKKIDFSDTRFMYLKPCAARGNGKIEEENTQLEKAHLHDNVGDVVHVEAKDPVWIDLFTNIKFPIDYSKTTGYIDLQKVPDFQNQPIRPYQILVVFIGENNEKLIQNGVTREYIDEQLKKSAECDDE